MQKIFWADLEMTGLDVVENKIIECAGIVTDLAMNTLDSFETVVFQPPEELAKMDEWNVRTHGESGLLARIPQGKPLDVVEEEVLVFLKQHFSEDDRPVLAGNSIHQDRKFIDRYMPRLSEFLHYRMIDVSAFKQIFNHLYGIKMAKSERHRALEDITESIAELQYYLRYIKVPEETTTL